MRLAGPLAIAIALARTAAAEPTCSPAARVAGDPELVGPVVGLLRERGVATGTSACGEILAVLARADGRVRVSVTDVDGRGVERVADDVESTATLIESFARSDVSAPLLQARDLPAAPAQAPDREAPPKVLVARPQPAPPVRRIELSAAADLGASNDGAIWTALRAQGCVQIGPACAGALVRYANDTDYYGDSAELVSPRWALDLLVVADAPLRWGAFILTPGIGLGITTVRSERELLDETAEDDTSGMQARAHLAAGTAISDVWSIHVDLAGGLTPFARERLGPRGEQLAGAPRAQLWFGVVLAYGGL